ncbi:hypothetical protein [Actinomadura miaoliensis]|uniref:hypothetical protein n=1 Tax=Actinomadura miaoliensis TaxID=430685 RepID=UPI0031E50A1C
MPQDWNRRAGFARYQDPARFPDADADADADATHRRGMPSIRQGTGSGLPRRQ